jgi:hypothetical protein
VRAVAVEGMPEDFAFGEIKPDWERMGGYIEKAMQRVPISQEVGVRKLFCGPSPSPRTCGRASVRLPSCRNYFVAAGLNSIGILTGGGVGRAMAHWIAHGRPDVDVTGFHLDRLHRYQCHAGVSAHAHGGVAGHGLPDPLPHAVDADGARRQARSAARPPGCAGRVLSRRQRLGGCRLVHRRRLTAGARPLSWGRPRWFPQWKAEHDAYRTGVILMDMSFMSKFLVQGRDAGRVLNHISANDVDGERARHVHAVAQRRRDAGGRPHRHQARADVRLGARYMVVASDTAHATWRRGSTDTRRRTRTASPPT